ncbi:MAG: RNA polymerase sigma-54 factor [Lentisphaerae bacterium GWF2_52_8]|nr:MAG: RNA polymerase sigma-54 factor [Lentisphaerae bacterium GWF2_52_8]
MPEHSLLQSQELRQEQILAPQQIQSLEILMVPLLELQERLSRELAENPVLEQEPAASEPETEEHGSETEEHSEEQHSPVQAEGDNDSMSDHEGGDDDVAQLIHLAESWRDQLPSVNTRSSFSSDDEERRQHFFDSLAEEPSLQEQLLEQLRLSDISSKKAHLAELLIGSIDETGYLRSHLADIATAGSASLAEVEDALSLVQAFDPPGIGARNLQECLLLQLRRQGREHSPLAQLIRDHLEDIAKNHLPAVAKSLKVSLNELYAIIEDLKTLSPFPGSASAPHNPVFVIPEVFVEKKGDEYAIVSNDEQMPRIRISNLYLKLLEDPNTPEETRNYIKAKLGSGKMLLRSLEQRQSTIRRIAEVIVSSQHDFFENGVESLRPMTMQQVADKLGVHETTISRAIANKYIQAPNGLFEFKYFFSGGYQASDGEEFSARSVKEKICDMVAKEDPAKPLSDEKICENLKALGIPVARRTVAKYREELGIQSSHLRREF